MPVIPQKAKTATSVRSASSSRLNVARVLSATFAEEGNIENSTPNLDRRELQKVYTMAASQAKSY